MFIRGRYYAYVPYIVFDERPTPAADYAELQAAARRSVCFDWDGGGVFDHVETVDTPPTSMARRRQLHDCGL